MLKKIKNCLLHTVLAALVLFAAGCGEEKETVKYTEHVPGEAFTPAKEGLTLLAEGDTMELYLDAATATIRWQNKESGEYLDTRVFDDSVGDVSLKSDFIATYFTGTEANRYASYATMDSYTYSVQQETVSYEKLENGVRVVYAIGSNKVSYKDFPAYITEERMQNLVMQYLDEKQTKTLLKQYRQLKSGLYARTTNKDNPLAGLAAGELYKLFYEVGHYTYEELEYDNTENNKLDEMPQRQHIQVVMEYSLDGDELVVRIPVKELSYSEDYPLKSFDFLPYFLSTQEKDGYLFVPDGSGALIYLDNTRTKEYQFTSRYWNGDVLINSNIYSTTQATMMAPVYGIKTSEHAVLGIIEKGAEVATLNAYVSGSYNNIPYSRVSLNFAIREDQTLATFSDATVNFTMKKSNTDYYADDVVVRYCFLTGDDADYSGMAAAYREYLLEKGALAQNQAEEKAPMFVELLGLVDSTEYLLGIPYEGSTNLTTFAQAKEILADMTARGIENIKVDYVGLANGGISQRTAEKVEICKELGGKKGLLDLVSYAQSVGAEIFPDFQLQTATTSRNFSKEKKAFFINGQVAERYEFEPVQQKALTDADYPTYIISPRYFETYLTNFEKSYSKLGIQSLASEDFMTFFSPDYKKSENISITTAMPVYEKALATLAEKYRLLLSNPVSESWSAVTYITDMPAKGSNLKVVDAYVPFVPLVLNGSIVYSTEVINTDSHDMNTALMNAIETGAALKFRFMAADTFELQNTEADDVFMAEYVSLKESAAELYAEYQTVYEQIKGARMERHERLDEDGTLVRVSYDNGVEIYLNYSDADQTANGVTIPADSYVVR